MNSTLSNVVRAGRVERLHTSHHHQPYTVGTHTWGMLVLLHALYPSAPGLGLTCAILHHDVAEAWLGDTPWPAKKRWPKLKAAIAEAEDELNKELGVGGYALTKEETHWLEALDALELLMYCYDEEALGNTTFAHIIRQCHELLTTPNVPTEVHRFFHDHYVRAEGL